MVKEVVFFYPIMKPYLKKFNTYTKFLYKGMIFADEFMFGMMASMFNIKLQLSTPSIKRYGMYMFTKVPCQM